jgi:hypothetical protein
MDNRLDLSKIYFIFYIPGSMGSLLLTLIRSQTEKNFKFLGFKNNTAHEYCKDHFMNTHHYIDFLNFKKSGKSLLEHLTQYKENQSSLFQRCDINWLSEFVGIDKFNCILSYVSDYDLKLSNFYVKLKDITLHSSYTSPHNFKIDRNHKDYDSIIFIKTINWLCTAEKEYMNRVPGIDMVKVLKKDFDAFKNICKITNIDILTRIIDDYNQINTTRTDIFPDKIKKYIKKHKNQV